MAAEDVSRSRIMAGIDKCIIEGRTILRVMAGVFYNL